MAFYGTFTDGKLSAVFRNGQSIGCCCGGGGVDCCMYSATELESGDMGASDLPVAITLLGVGSLPRSGTGYGDTTGGVIFETDVWAIYRADVRTTRNCLIQGDGNLTPGDDLVEDQFSATYSVTIFHWYFGTLAYTVTRTSLCNWEFGDPDDVVYVSLAYYDDTDGHTWNVVYINQTALLPPEQAVKNGSRSSPVGSYSTLPGPDASDFSASVG